MPRAVVSCAMFLALASVAATQQITVATLANEIGDVRTVAFAPVTPYTASQFSSYDRRSTDPARRTDDGWFANGDQGNFLRVAERDGRREFVMADVDGPGAVTRIWSADPKGILRVYVDGETKPAIEAPFDKLLGGQHPLAPAPLSGVRAKGWNLHLPIPYAKHLEITLSEKQVYYHVNVRTYPARTPVKSWSEAEARAAKEALEAAAKRLATCGLPEIPKEGPHRAAVGAQPLAPGARVTKELSQGSAGGMVTALVARLNVARDRARAWRGTVLQWRFDGELCVETPLGDFFGSGPGMPAFDSIAAGVGKDGVAWSRWVMPFSKSCEVTVANLGSDPVDVALEARIDELPAGARPRHFHANWRQQIDVPTRPRQDWNALTADGGAGVYVGCAFSILNPVTAWWGEGDEKMFVDGEKLPSTFGTGSEDFFGYAWSNPELFEHALHGQPRCDGPGTKGFTALYRWQLLDCVPWTRSFRFDFEVWHWKDCLISQAMAVYWYADAGVRAAFPPLDALALAIPVARVPEVKRVAGAIEGEALTVLEKTGVAAAQDMADFGDGLWSGDAQLWWRGAKVGDRLVLLLPAPKAGRYRVIGAFTKARDYGIHRIAIEGHPAGEPRDFHDERVVPSGEVDLGTFELREGQNRFEVVVAGANAKAVREYMFGLDYLRLEPAK